MNTVSPSKEKKTTAKHSWEYWLGGIRVEPFF